MLDRLLQELEHRSGQLPDGADVPRSCEELRDVAKDADAQRLDACALEP
jgi:hypothetical protein